MTAAPAPALLVPDIAVIAHDDARRANAAVAPLLNVGVRLLDHCDGGQAGAGGHPAAFGGRRRHDV
ncbi:hypothetical protein AB0D59_24350 [Streptomyces sp. NPDC048417]|uniref:hypothetical protein n=1 Tax=Streptomyces sp. NPDC048417 TaxID=3155387 RepID=UPI0034127032